MLLIYLEMVHVSEIKKLLKDYIAAWNNKDVDAVIDLFTNEFTIVVPYHGLIHRTGKQI